MVGYYNGEKYELANFRNYTWVRVFYHDGSGGWFNSTTAKHTGSYGDKRYSRLDIIQNLKTATESKYVFCLVYPEQSDRWNIWKQSYRPQDDYNNTSNSAGYEPLVINSSGSSWGGLSCSNQYALIDGDKYSTNWWFAVGSYQSYSTSTGIPGPNDIVVTKVELWVATDLNKFTFDNNTQFTFDYFGNYQRIDVNPGRYKLECWGAEGGGRRLSGNGSSGLGGYGGYSCGTIFLKQPTTLYIYVGGYGGWSTSGPAAGGFNGGGSGYASSSSEPGNGGGGGSDIRIGSTSLYARVIVAGGGGGGGEDASDPYGHGGGASGTNGAGSCSNGTQTSAGTGGGFGYGGSTGNGDGGGGGGGWYGGGTSSSSSVGSDTQGGGGGSGYVYTSSTYTSYPSGCLLNSNYYLTDTQNTAAQRTGHGYVRITCLQTAYNLIYTNCSGNKSVYTAGAGETVTINVGTTLSVSGLLYYFNTISNSSNIPMSKVSDTQYQMTIPTTTFNDITITAVFNKRKWFINYYWQPLNLSYKYIKTTESGISTNQPNTENLEEYAVGFTKRVAVTEQQNYNDVNVYYDRNKYTFTLNKNTGIDSVSGGGTYYYEQEVTIDAVVSVGYNWNKFDGYEFSQTKPFSFIMPASAVTITAYAVAMTNIKYVVNHYLQKVTESEYDLIDTEENIGTTDTTVNATLNSYTNYITPSQQSVKIKGDGTSVVNYYYNRIKYLVTLNKDNHISTVTGAGSYIWGKTVTINANPEIGYHFSEWTGDKTSNNKSLSFVMPLNNLTISAFSSPDTDTKYTIYHYIAKIGVSGYDYANDYLLNETDERYGTTDTTVQIFPKTIEGFTPTVQSKDIEIKGDGTGYINYYYSRNKYNLTLLNEHSHSDKYIYEFEEEGNLEYTKPSGASVYIFDSWLPDKFINIIDGYQAEVTTFRMPAYDVTIDIHFKMKDRLNSNIYKNIFEHVVIDLWNIQDKLAKSKTIKTRTATITQYNHGFKVYDLIIMNRYGVYAKALANVNEYRIIGMVMQVIDDNNFILMRYGQIFVNNFNLMSESGILYLSDTERGKMCRYEDITTMFYTPVAFYTGNSLILNIMDSSIGDVMREYNRCLMNTNLLTFVDENDKQDIIDEVLNNS